MKLLTPPGVAGIAVLRIDEGERDRVFAALRHVDGRPPAVVVGGAAVRATLRLRGREVDDVLVVSRCDGVSELHVHGSPAVLEAIAAEFSLDVSAGPMVGGSVAHPANELLASAMSVMQYDLAVEQLRWDFGSALADVQRQPLEQRAAGLRAMLERSRIARAMVTPCRVVLIGRQNAGKSTLFNHLLFRERAVTGPTPGLTRDAIAEVTTLDGYPYELVDTAGEGDATTEQDEDAIARGRRWRESALSVVVVDASVGPDAIDRDLARVGQFVIATKGDLQPAAWPDDLACSLRVAVHASNPASVRDAFGEMLRRHRQLPVAGPVGGVAALRDDQLADLERLVAADEEGV